MAGADLNLTKLEYAKALSVGNKELAEKLKAKGDAIVQASQPKSVSLNSGTFQAEPGFFETSSGTLPNAQGRF